MEIRENVPLSSHTTFHIGGDSRYFAVIKSAEDLHEAVSFSRARKLHMFILGGGSNLLVSDRGFDGMVLKMEIRGVYEEDRGEHVLVRAAAGEGWDEFVDYTVRKGYWGLENLSAIPGTVGASPVQNIGAYGTEVMDYIEEVQTVNFETGRERTFSNAECGFSYRDSIFKKPDYRTCAIISVTFKLSKQPKPNLSYKDLKEYFAKEGIEHPRAMEIRDAVIAIRSGKFPDISRIGTAGSFWKNPIICREHYEGIKKHFPDLPSFPADAPAGSRKAGGSDEAVKVPLAWVLDRICGLKGYREGLVRLFEKQPLVLVAERGATASDIDSFAAKIAKIVKEKTGIEIEREVRSLS